MTAEEFKKWLEQIPLRARTGPRGKTVQIRDPGEVNALCFQALESISVNGDVTSRKLAKLILENLGR
jgi:hypothetical protein